MRRVAIALLASALSLEACAPAAPRERSTPTTAPTDKGNTVVDTDSGALTGKPLDGGVRAFLGVPYAEPPVGARRWRPPEPVARWTGARDATHVGDACLQFDGDKVMDHASEDCLTLNVWVPPLGAAKKPVLVFFPGGGFVEGGGGLPLYDGAKLAAREDAVVVTLNYRLGPFGFLVHRDLAKEAGRATSPSFGLLDQREGLRWLHRNVAALGGDPDNVTIFGESAGAWSVCAHMVMPGSRGLFARGIMESGACADPLYFGANEAKAQGDRFAQALGCADIACLRGKDATAVLKAIPLKRHYVLPPGESWAPVVDGVELPDVPLEAIRAGKGANVPLIIGWNRDEGILHTVHFETITADERDSFVRDSFGDAAVAPVSTRYARPTPKDALTDIVTDGAFACESRRVARALESRGTPGVAPILITPLAESGAPELVG